MSKVHVVGAGPAGSIAAISAVRAGHNVIMSEEHQKAGMPENCSGIFSIEGLESLKPVISYKRFVINKLWGANIFFGKEKLMIRAKKAVGCACDRSLMDEELASRAQLEGVKVIYNEKVKDNYQASNIIGADGPHSTVAKNFKMGKIPKYVSTLQAKVEMQFNEPGAVEIYLSNKNFPGFFGWIIPHDEYSGEMGVGVQLPHNVTDAWNYLMKLKKIKEPPKPAGAIIPKALRECTAKTVDRKNILLVGDAAGQVKSTSVDYSEPILISRRGLLRNEFIGEFVNNRIKKSNFIIAGQTPQGYRETYVSGNVYGAAVNNGFKTTSAPVTRVLKHNISEKLYELELKNGFRVKTTGSHSVMCFDNFSLVEKKVSSLKAESDHLLMSLNIPNNEKLTKINLIEMILEEAPHLINSIRVRGGRELLFKKSTDIDKRYRSAYWGRNSIPLKKFLEKGIIPQNVKLVFEPPKKKVEINNLIEITNEFARLLGYIVAEASIGKDKVCLVFGKEDEKKGVIKDAIKCIRNVFGINHQKIRIKKNPITGKTSSYSICFGGKLLGHILSDVLKIGRGARSKQVPFLIYNVKKRFKKEFLKGYLIGDGTIRIRTPKNRRNWSAEISAKTASYKLASDLVLLAIQLELLPTIQYEKGGQHIWNGKKIKSGSSYRICFSNKNNLTKLSDVFPDIKNELTKFLKETEERTTIGLPKKYLESGFIRNLFLNYGGKFFKKNYHSYDTYSYDLLEQILNNFKGTDPRIKALKKIVKEKLYLLPIKKIRRVASSTDEVFDIEVDKTHTFLGGLGPIVLHNTGGGVIFGGGCAKLAGKYADNPMRYEIEWRLRFGTDLMLHRMIRDFLDKMSDKKIEEFGRSLQKMRFDEYLSRDGNMDRPTSMIKPQMVLHLLKNFFTT
jgi:flavin-dependent dehydrogenase